MPRVSQKNFNRGEIGPLVDSRSDLNAYRSALARVENYRITPHGPLIRRMGFKFVAETKYHDKRCRVLGFQASSAEAFCIELGDLYMRFHRNGEPVLDGGLPYELVTPWTEDQIFNIQIETINDVIWACHQDVPVQVINFFTDTDWTIAPMDFDWPPFMNENLTGTTLTISSVTNVPIVTEKSFVVSTGGVNVASEEIQSAGPYEVTIHSLAVDPPATPGAFLRLEGSIDGGATWTTLHTFVATGTTSGSYTGIIRLIANNYTVDADYEASINNPEISPGDTITVTASSPTFTNDSVGRFYSISHPLETNELRMSLMDGVSERTSGVISVKGEWSIFTGGIWDGTILVERSRDGGLSWEVRRSFTVDEDRNLDQSFTEPERVLIRMRYVDVGPSGGDGRWATLSVAENVITGVFEVTGYTSATVVDGVVIQPFISAEPSNRWRAGAWSTETGYPRCVKWHANRLVFAGSKEQGAAIWLSKVEDYYDFEYGTDDDEAFTRTLGGLRQESIVWLASKSALGIGTTGGEWLGLSEQDRKVVTPTTFSLELQTGVGGEPLGAVLANNAVLFYQQSGRKLREFSFALTDNSFASTDLTSLAVHITRGGAVDMALQRQRDTHLLTTLGSGQIADLIYERQQEVVGFSGFTTNGSFESVACIFEGGEEDSIYTVVKRDINGEEKRYIERLVPNQMDLLEAGILADMPYMDSFVTYDGTSTSPGFTNFTTYKAALDAVPIFTNTSSVNAYAAIKAACDEIVWDSDPGTTRAIIALLDTPNAGLTPTQIATAAALNTEDIVFHWGPSHPGENFSGFATATGGTTMTEGQMNTQALMLSKLLSLFTANDKLQLCIIIDQLATPADAINFQTIITSFKNAATQLNTGLLNLFDNVNYSLITVNGSGYTFQTTGEGDTESIIGGLEHLVGETVQILADGVDMPEQVVTNSGTVTLPNAAAKVHVGLRYNSYGQTLPLSIQMETGDTQGLLKQGNQLYMRTWRSVNCEIAPTVDYSGVWEPLSNSGRNRVGNNPEITMGSIGGLEDWKFHIPGNSQSDLGIAFRQNRPLPHNILSIGVDLDVTEPK